MTGQLMWVAITRPEYSTKLPTAADKVAWWQPTPADHWYLVVYTVAIAAALVSFTLLQHRGVVRRQEWLVVLAAITILLGAASYGPCGDGTSWGARAIGVLNLFLGQVEGGLVGPGAAVCTGPYTLPFQAARLAGAGTVVMAGVMVIASYSSRFMDREWTRWARDIDVVVGLNPQSLQLVKALLDERAAETEAPRWCRRRVRDWFAGLVPFLSGVLVLRVDENDELLERARELGAHVYLDDPTDAATWERLLLRKPNRHPFRWIGAWVLRRVGATLGTSARATRFTEWADRLAHKSSPLRRLFAVSLSQDRNTKVVAAASGVIGRATDAKSNAWLYGNMVPRLVARFDDTRTARSWRITQLNAPGCFVDAFTSDELVARSIVESIRANGIGTVQVVGDSPLTIAILDELAVTQAFDYDQTPAGPGEPPRPPHRIVVVDADAAQIASEWTTTRARTSPAVLAPEPDSRNWEVVANELAHGTWGTSPSGLDKAAPGGEGLATKPGRVAIIICHEHAPSVTARALRIRQRWANTFVYCPSPHAKGLEVNSSGVEGVMFFGPSLLQRRAVPEDSWTILARWNHDPWVKPGSPLVTARPWDVPVGASGDRLPLFFREDTLRQQRLILQFFAQNGYRWQMQRVGHPEPLIPEDECESLLDRLSEEEHRRWYRTRRALGWHWAPTPTKLPGDDDADFARRDRELRIASDFRRRHRDMVDWDTGRRSLPWWRRALLGNADLSGASETGQPTQPELGLGGQMEVFEVHESTLGHLGSRNPSETATKDAAIEKQRKSDREKNEKVLTRIRLMGLVPVRLYPRHGVVLARHLRAGRAWTTVAGTAMWAAQGDWWITDIALGREWSISADEFNRNYEPVLGATLNEAGDAAYRRIGMVMAVQASGGERIVSMEGEEVAQPGEWVLTDDAGNSWVSSAEDFGRLTGTQKGRIPEVVRPRSEIGRRLLGLGADDPVGP